MSAEPRGRCIVRGRGGKRERGLSRWRSCLKRGDSNKDRKGAWVGCWLRWGCRLGIWVRRAITGAGLTGPGAVGVYIYRSQLVILAEDILPQNSVLVAELRVPSNQNSSLQDLCGEGREVVSSLPASLGPPAFPSEQPHTGTTQDEEEGIGSAEWYVHVDGGPRLPFASPRAHCVGVNREAPRQGDSSVAEQALSMHQNNNKKSLKSETPLYHRLAV